MKKILLFFCLGLPAVVSAQEARHPGAPYTVQNLGRAKALALEGKQPWAEALQALFKEADEALKRPVTSAPERMIIPRRYADPEGHMKAREKIGTDAWAAHALALAAWMADDPAKSDAYARKGIDILMAWTKAEDIGAMGEQREAALVSCTSGNGLIVAADLLYQNPNWSTADREAFLGWVKRVYHPATEVRNIEYHNNWNCWGVYAHLLACHLTEDQAGFNSSSRLLKKLIEEEIESDGSMPKELARGEGKHWYTYYALTPLILGADVAGSAAGENLLAPQSPTGKKLAQAVDYFFTRLEAAPYRDLLEGYGGLADDKKYLEYNLSKRPVTGIRAHSGWNFPTLFLRPENVPFNRPPKALARPALGRATAGEEIELDASGSSDPDGKVQDFLWNQPAEPKTFALPGPLRGPADVFVFPEALEGDFSVSFQLKMNKTANMAVALQSEGDSGTGWSGSSYLVNTKDGLLKVRDGSGYRSDQELGYRPGDSIRIRMAVKAQEKTCDVFADMGNGEAQLAGNYAIRDDKKERRDVRRLRYIGEEGAEISGIEVLSPGGITKGDRLRVKFDKPGSYKVKLTVFDNLGSTDTVEIPIAVDP